MADTTSESAYRSALAKGARAASRAFARGLRPDPVLKVSEWAARHIVLPSDSPYPGKFDPDFFPPLRRILDCCSPGSGYNRVTEKKSAQIGGSLVTACVLGYYAHAAPAAQLFVHPTVEAGKDWAAEKLDPIITASPTLRATIREPVSRDEQGSTMRRKRYRGGWAVITGANSARGLRQKSVRVAVCDDWSDFPLDVGGQGDPDKMVEARQISFHARGDWLKVEISTPTDAATCRVSKSYEAGTRERWHVRCPEPACGELQPLEFKNLKYDVEGEGEQATVTRVHGYACRGCGVIIPEHRKLELIRSGEWIAENPDARGHASFAINALYSPVTTWAEMAERFERAKGDPGAMKTWVNLWDGEPWEDKGDAPPWKALLARALTSVFKRGIIPPGGLWLTLGIDVQKHGIYWELVAWGRGRTSWSVDFGYIETPVEDPATKDRVRALWRRTWADSFGNSRAVDRVGIDANYSTAIVHDWVRGEPRVIPTRGLDGRQRRIIEPPRKEDVTRAGKARRLGLKSWGIGTWTVRELFYALLRREGPAEGQAEAAPGYCWFTAEHDERFFRQLTAEVLITRTPKGAPTYEWTNGGRPNHWHDCRLVALAVAESLGLSQMTDDAWDRIAAERELPAPAAQGELAGLFAPTSPREPAKPPPAGVPPAVVADVDAAFARRAAPPIAPPSRPSRISELLA